MDINKKRGFTLAELMIVFTVIGVLTAILVPVLFAASPDQSELKAKKAYNTFTRTVENLTNGEPYDVNDGVLDATPFINLDSDAKRNNFLCNNIAELLNVKYSNCNNVNAGNITISASAATAADSGNQILNFNTTSNLYEYEFLQQNLDNICTNYVTTNTTSFEGDNFKDYYSFITGDNVGWIVQKYDFSRLDSQSNGGVDVATFFGLVCFNTGKLKSGETDDIYAMGVNRVGKIVVGKKLQDLIDQDFEEAAE